MRGFLIIPLFLIFTGTQAQRFTSVGLYYNQFFASEEYKSNITRNPLGSAVYIGISDSASAVQYGLEIGMGLHSGKKYFYQTADLGAPDNIDYIYEENGFIYYHLSVKLSPVKRGVLYPYAEIRAGLSSFFSAVRAMQYSAVFEDRFQFDDTILSGFLGGGVRFDLGKTDWKRRLLMDISYGYLLSSDATYRNSVKHVIIDSYDELERKSNVNAHQLRVGVNLVF